MKAVIWEKYAGPESQVFGEMQKPILKDGQVLVKIHATSVNAGDCETRELKLPLILGLPVRLFIGFKKPKRIRVLGQDFAGEVAEIGPKTSVLKTGDKIFGATGFLMGTYAQYVAVNEAQGDSVWAYIPEGLSYEEVASVPVSALEAIYYLKKADIKNGDKLLINGAGGSIGTFAIQLAKFYGAEVTAVDSNEKLETMKMIGADYVVDYTKQDFLKSGISYDVIFDIVGKNSFTSSLKSLKKGGKLLISSPGLLSLFLGKLIAKIYKRNAVIGAATRDVMDLNFLAKLIKDKKIASVIDKKYTLVQIPEAHRYAQSGHKKGTIVVKVEH